MKKLLVLLLLCTGLSGIITNKSFAQTAPASTALSGIGDNSDYAAFAGLVRSANLDATLAGLGTYTVFAPHNVIFRNMSAAKSDSLTGSPEKLALILKAHIVKGKFTSAEIIKKLEVGKGKTTLMNILGQPLKLSRTKDNKLLITDNKGNQASFLAFDIKDPHGVIHGIDNVLVIGK